MKRINLPGFQTGQKVVDHRTMAAGPHLETNLFPPFDSNGFTVALK